MLVQSAVCVRDVVATAQVIRMVEVLILLLGVALYELCIREEWTKAMSLQTRLWSINEMFAKYNLAACIKVALQEQGYPVGDPIRPQRRLTDSERASIASALQEISTDRAA